MKRGVFICLFGLLVGIRFIPHDRNTPDRRHSTDTLDSFGQSSNCAGYDTPINMVSISGACLSVALS